MAKLVGSLLFALGIIAGSLCERTPFGGEGEPFLFFLMAVVVLASGLTLCMRSVEG